MNKKKKRTIGAFMAGKHIHTSLNSSLWATASKHSCPVLSTESVNSTNSPLSSWIRVTRQLLLETVYLRVLLSFKPNGRGMFHARSKEEVSARARGTALLDAPWEKLGGRFKSWGSSSADNSGKKTRQTQNFFKHPAMYLKAQTNYSLCTLSVKILSICQWNRMN